MRDDSFINDNQILQMYNNLYDALQNLLMGRVIQCRQNTFSSTKLSRRNKKKKEYRKYKFNWNMPYTHLRTFKFMTFKWL
ncbi:MAG: hypothetical protein CM15mV25_0680 [uncultured marine virus]|nr:MAG: hypothetical protein CM15mV25_0680 [uncultured marine virus]